MRWTATQPALTTPSQVGSGGPQAVSTPTAKYTRRHCYKTAWSLLQGGIVYRWAALSRAQICTPRRAVPGLLQAASTPHALVTRRRCYKTAWSLLQGDW